MDQQPLLTCAGWKRYGITVPGFNDKVRGWHVCYFSAASTSCVSVLETGVQTAAMFGTSMKSGELADHGMVVTQSIVFAAHPSFAPVVVLREGGVEKFVQMVFMCRIRPGSFAARAVALPAGTVIDKWISNDILELVIRRRDTPHMETGGLLGRTIAQARAQRRATSVFDSSAGHTEFSENIVCYGIMLRKLDRHPSELPESRWWPAYDEMLRGQRERAGSMTSPLGVTMAPPPTVESSSS